jgi:hypothetical protein
LEFEPVVEAMTALGWTLPQSATAAAKVRGGLDRFQLELEEWSAEVRKRPKWSVPVEWAVDHEAFETALVETAKIFGLRAISGAASDRGGNEILRDLESISLLSRHSWKLAGALNPLIWEVVKTRRLTDGELMTAAGWLIEEPPIRPLLRAAYLDSLAYNEGCLAAGLNAGNEGPAYWKDEILVSISGPIQTWFHEVFCPSGWYRLSEAREIRCMIGSKIRAESSLASWRGEKPLPDVHGLPQSTLMNHPMPLPYWYSSFGAHLMSCGCQLSTVWQAAVDARIAMVMIGLERYRLRHGKWPDHLTDVADFIPKGLRHVPMHEDCMGYTVLPEGGWELSAGKNFPKWMMPFLP